MAATRATLSVEQRESLGRFAEAHGVSLQAALDRAVALTLLVDRIYSRPNGRVLIDEQMDDGTLRVGMLAWGFPVPEPRRRKREAAARQPRMELAV